MKGETGPNIKMIPDKKLIFIYANERPKGFVSPSLRSRCGRQINENVSIIFSLKKKLFFKENISAPNSYFMRYLDIFFGAKG